MSEIKITIETLNSPEGDWISNAHPDNYGKDRPLDWLHSVVYGPPRATMTKSVETLRGMGLVGVYFKKKSKAQ